MKGRKKYFLFWLGTWVISTGCYSLATAAQNAIHLQYRFKEGDVLTYKQIFEEESQILRDKEEMVRLHLEWLVKIAVTKTEDQTYHLAIQTNRQKAEIKNRKAILKSLGKRVVESLEKSLNTRPLCHSFYVMTDTHGKILNNIYFLNELSSPLIMLMARLFQLPETPVRPNHSYTWQDEYRLNVKFKGEKKMEGRKCWWLKATGPGSDGSLVLDQESGVPVVMTFSDHYNFYHRQSREELSWQLMGRENLSPAQMANDPHLRQALLKTAVKQSSLRLAADQISGFLNDSNQANQMLASVYCSQKGLPDGVEIDPHIRSEDSTIRFNVAKALFRFRGQIDAIKTLTSDADPLVRRRAQNFLRRSTDMVEEADRPLLRAIQEYIYGEADDGDNEEPRTIQEISTARIERIRNLMDRVKPVNNWDAGALRFFAEVNDGPQNIRQPYFVHLPRDYDPRELYPLIIFLGGGGGRGDFTFLSTCRVFEGDGVLNDYILLVPQAEGRWWEKEREMLFREVLGQMVRRFSIDTDRIYLSGYSNGGTGSYYYSVHDPQRYPAIFSIMGFPFLRNEAPLSQDDMKMLRSLRNTAVYLVHGDKDEDVDVRGDRFAHQFLRRVGYPVRYKELKGRGHNIRLAEISRDLIGWFNEHPRNPNPTAVTFRMNSPLYRQSYWLRIDREQKLPAEVSAHVTGNSILIKTVDVASLTVFLNRHMVDLSQKVTIKINDKEVYNEIPKPDVLTLLRTARDRLDPRLSYSISLPFSVK